MPTFLACQVECLNLNTNFLLFCDLINRVIFGLIIFCYGQFFISKTKYKQKGRKERKTWCTLIQTKSWIITMEY